MHLAIVGVCPHSRELASAAVSLGHQLTWYVADGERAAAELARADRVRQQIHLAPQAAWETLLDSPAIDGVLLAEAAPADVELRSEQWRRLTQAGGRILLVHPVVPSLLVYLEIDMLARESGAVLVPYWPDAFSDAASRLATLTPGPSYGVGSPRIEQVVFRRLTEDRSPATVTKWFARDAALLDVAAGPFTEIAAIGPDVSEEAYASLVVHLYAPAGVPARWEVGRAAAGEQGVLSAAGGEDLLLTFDAAPQNAAGGAVASEAIRGIRSFAVELAGPSWASPQWQRSVRAMELADSIEISLRRGRRIDIYYRQMTEETSYKGMMSAVGCGLLLLAPLVLVVAGIFNALFGWRLARFWYVPVLVIFVAFLLLQLLARAVVKRPASGPTGGTQSDIR